MICRYCCKNIDTYSSHFRTELAEAAFWLHTLPSPRPAESTEEKVGSSDAAPMADAKQKNGKRKQFSMVVKPKEVRFVSAFSKLSNILNPC
jgi:hypothetical protein